MRDTKLERTSHEATGKHQGNLKRFLRDLHRGNEREERDKQRAKDEVQRLNGVVSGSPTASYPQSSSWKRKPAMDSPMQAPQQVPLEERKKQLSQLAEMGVAIPEEFRRDMAMAGDRQTLSVRQIYDGGVKEEAEDVKPDVPTARTRKRRFEGDEEDDENEHENEALDEVKRKAWGSRFKTYADTTDDSEDLDALLQKSKTLRSTLESPRSMGGGASETAPISKTALRLEKTQDMSTHEEPTIKREDSDESASGAMRVPGGLPDVHIKHEERPPGTGIVFKKRKSKPVGQNNNIGMV